MARSRPPDDPDLLAARRALADARVEARIRTAIAAAPPLDEATLARLRALMAWRHADQQPPPGD